MDSPKGTGGEQLPRDHQVALRLHMMTIRGTALCFVAAFFSMWLDAAGLVGTDGLFPCQATLAVIRRDYDVSARLLYFPSVFWLFGDSTAVLELTALCGVLLSCWMAAGLPHPAWLRLTLWALFGSFSVCEGTNLWFPWDGFALEAAVLLSLFPAVVRCREHRSHSLRTGQLRQLPRGEVSFAMRWLLFRVMFGFGKKKFLWASLDDALYTKTVGTWGPLPSWLGWWFHLLPNTLHYAGYAAWFCVEMVLSVALLLSAGRCRSIAAGATVALMLGIMPMGHFAWFNLLTIAVALVPLAADGRCTRRPDGVSAAVVAYLVLSAPFIVPSQWGAPGCLAWDSFELDGLPYVPLALSVPLLRLLRITSAWRLTHAYGVFPQQINPNYRQVPLFEVSSDGGATWHSCEYKYQVSRLDRPGPMFLAPLFPRFDYFVYYELNRVQFFADSDFHALPYARASEYRLPDRVGRALLDGNVAITSLFAYVPRPTDGRTLTHVRLRSEVWAPASEGAWWTVESSAVRWPTEVDSPSSGGLGREELEWRFGPSHALSAITWLPEPYEFTPNAYAWLVLSTRMRTLPASADGLRAWIQADSALVDDAWGVFWRTYPPLALASHTSANDLAKLQSAQRRSVLIVLWRITRWAVAHLAPHATPTLHQLPAQPSGRPYDEDTFFNGSASAHAVDILLVQACMSVMGESAFLEFLHADALAFRRHRLRVLSWISQAQGSVSAAAAAFALPSVETYLGQMWVPNIADFVLPLCEMSDHGIPLARLASWCSMRVHLVPETVPDLRVGTR
jgi:hypothetical protein